MSPMLLVVGVLAVAAALLVLALVVLPAGPTRVPLNRLDPSVAPSASPRSPGRAPPPAPPWRRCWPSAVGRRRSGRPRAGRHVDAAAGLRAGGRAGHGRAATVGAVLGGLLLGLLLLVGVPFGAKLLLKFRASRRQAAFADQLDDSLQLMAGSLRAGHSLLRSVDSVASGGRRPDLGGVLPDRQRDPRRPRPQRRAERGRRADGQRRLHLGRPGDRHPPRGRRQPGRGARRRRSHHPRAQRDPPPGQGACRPRASCRRSS